MANDFDYQKLRITHNCIDCISPAELSDKLRQSRCSGKPLKVKVGFDPTARDIHLGHTVLLRKLRKFQDLGHIVYFIIGDFTARIGDPSGKTELRPVLSQEEIEDNAKTYTSQAFKILNPKQTKIFFNSQWYEKMNLDRFIKLLSRYTVAQLIQRDDFSKRLKENKPLTLQELVYPVIQGYDSVFIKADIEIGGNDQKFNLILARHLQQNFDQSPQVVLTLPLLIGLDGVNKMSKSLNNYVAITDEPQDMFGKLMSLSDKLMWEYVRLLTELKPDELKKMHPKDAKITLAKEIVSFYHDSAAAEKAEDEFRRVFSQKKTPSHMPIYKTSIREIDVVSVIKEAGLVNSKREARRLLAQKAISCNNCCLDSPTITLEDKETVLKVGKRKFLKVVWDK